MALYFGHGLKSIFLATTIIEKNEKTFGDHDFMIGFHLKRWENFFRSLAKNISYSGNSLKNSGNYLSKVEEIAIKICEENNMEFERIPIADDEKIAGFHYIQFKNFFDGEPNDFEDVYLMEVFALFYHYNYGRFNIGWRNVYKNFVRLSSIRSKKFQDGIKIAQIKNKDKFVQFKKLYEEYLK